MKKAGISKSSYQNQSSGNDVEIVQEDSTRSKTLSNQGNVDVDFDELRDKFVTGNWGKDWKIAVTPILFCSNEYLSL